jgi:hypothetical protein
MDGGQSQCNYGSSQTLCRKKISAEDLGYFKASQVSIGNVFDFSFLRIFSEFFFICILFADLQFNKQGWHIKFDLPLSTCIYNRQQNVPSSSQQAVHNRAVVLWPAYI